MTTTQLLLDGFAPAKPKKRQAPVILARRRTACGYRCGHDIRIGEPIFPLESGRWAHTHDARDSSIVRRGAQLLGEKLLEKTGSRLVDEPTPDGVWGVNGAGLIDDEDPQEALEETAEWQRAHLPPEERWHPGADRYGNPSYVEDGSLDVPQ